MRLHVAASLVIVSMFGLAGCSRQQDGPSAEDLVRRQQLRESEQRSRPQTLDEKLAAIHQHMTRGNLPEAQRGIRQLLVSNPNHTDVVMLAAVCEAEAGQLGAAVKLLDTIDDTDPEAQLSAWWLAAEWLLGAGQYDAAQQKLEQILERRDDAIEAHRRLALILNNQGRRFEAARHLMALARSGEISEKELFAMNCYGDPFIDDSIPKPDFEGGLVPAALVKAKILRAEGDMVAARELAQRLSAAFPQSTPISAFLGRVYADFQDDTSLRRWAESTPKGIQREPEYWQTLGLWLQRVGRHREAVRCLAEAVIRDQTDRVAYTAMARSFQNLGLEAASEKASQRFALLSESAAIAKRIGLRPGSSAELNRMAEILEQLERPWEAIAWRVIAAKTKGQQQDLIANLESQRKSLLASVDGDAEYSSPGFRICGIDLAEWPLPSTDSIGLGIDIEPEHKAPRSPSSFEFQDVAADVGLLFQYDSGDDPSDDRVLLHQLTGGGITVVDYDLDGHCDIYLTQGGGDAFDPNGCEPNRMYRNLDGKQFVDVAGRSQTIDRGYGQGVAVADINQDGFPDLVVANIGPNWIFRNNGDGTFSRRAMPQHRAGGDWTTSIACGDVSGDHLPEILEVNYVEDPSAMVTPCTAERPDCAPSEFRAAVDQVWSVNSDMSLSAWDGCRDMNHKPSYGFAAVIANFDAKVGNDIFIANDRLKNHYWVSQAGEAPHRHQLFESSLIHGCGVGLLGQQQGCMGVAHGDFDRNGTLDLHVTNFWNQPSDLYLQDTDGLFSNANAGRQLYNDSRKTVGWGTQAVDFDSDGWLDLVVLNGHLQDFQHHGQPFRMRPQLFRGSPDRYRLMKPTRPSDYWSTPKLGRTLAVLDWNSDGRMDLAALHLDIPVALLENRSDTGNHIQIELAGTTSERDAIGATVTVSCGDQSWSAWVVGGDGFLCSNERVLDFGVGDFDTIDQLEILWPSGKSQRFQHLPTNRRWLVIEGDAGLFARQ